jgi:hypothetical protein
LRALTRIDGFRGESSLSTWLCRIAMNEAMGRLRSKPGDFDVMLPPKKTGTIVLKKAGTVEYYCRFHLNMKAAERHVVSLYPAAGHVFGSSECHGMMPDALAT